MREARGLHGMGRIPSAANNSHTPDRNENHADLRPARSEAIGGKFAPEPMYSSGAYVGSWTRWSRRKNHWKDIADLGPELTCALKLMSPQAQPCLRKVERPSSQQLVNNRRRERCKSPRAISLYGRRIIVIGKNRERHASCQIPPERSSATTSSLPVNV
jgi:hypothetical protein